MSGPAWTRMVARANQTGSLNMSDVSPTNNDLLLAKAFVSARTNNPAMRQQVIDMIAAARSTTGSARSLEIGRNAAPLVIAASVIGYHGADDWFLSLRDTNWPEQGSLKACQQNRPNNWGGACGYSRVAIDLHVGDSADLALARNIYLAWTCDPRGSNTFKWGDLSWQFDTKHLCGVNVRGASRSGVDLDGIQPDDQRRARPFPNFECENYVWQMSGEALVESYLLNEMRAGDDALARSYARYQRGGCTAAGDDRWQVPMANRLLGTTLTSSGMQDGKSFAFSDWLFGS